MAAALRAATGPAPSSILRAMVAYTGVAIWGWRLVTTLPPSDALVSFRYAPPLYVAFSLLLLGFVAATHERGVAALTAEWRLLLLRSAVQLALGYVYVALVQWVAKVLDAMEDPSKASRSSPSH